MSFNFKINIIVPLLLAFIFTGCKKVEQVTVNIQTPKSSFKVMVNDPIFKNQKESTSNFLDSVFYFKNLSETAKDITYKWDFGDGSNSKLQSPTHAYTTSGLYKVVLTTNKADKASDTSSVILSVIVGQREITIGPKISTSPINIIETNDNNYLLLGNSYDQNIFPYNITTFLIKLDKNLKQQSIKTFPASTQLSAIAACTDGNYIAIGTTNGNSVKSELIKITDDGNLLWSKVINSDGLINVQQTPDNGFIVTGSRIIKDTYNNSYDKSLIIKTDDNGNVKWERFFNQNPILEQAANVVIQNDGYVLAAVKRKDSGKAPSCSYCDSVCLVKLNQQGDIERKNTVNWGLNTSTFNLVRVSKMNNGNYNVVAGNTTGLFFFLPTGEFTDRKLLKNPAKYSTFSTDGNILVMETETGNGFRSIMEAYTQTGEYKWNIGINGYQQSACCSSSWPIIVNPLKNGGAIFLSNKIDMTDYHDITTIIKVDKNGQVL